MATLTNPQLKITLVSGSNQADVEASVGVSLTPLEQFLIANGLGLSLRCELWAADSGLYGGDDLVRVVGTRAVPVSTTHTFKLRVPRSALDEDSSIFDDHDELYAKMWLRSNQQVFPLDITVKSPEVGGEF
jgi:hypothetical protein